MSFASFVKIVLAALLFACLLEMPYGYYQLVRMSGLIGFAILAYDRYQAGQGRMAILYMGLALLFQPFVPISLGRELWMIIDVVVALWLVISLFLERHGKSPSDQD